MIWSCIVIEDEKIAIEKIKLYLDRISDFEFTKSFVTAEDFIKSTQILDPKVIFLDINLPGLSGIDIAKLLDKKDKIIFTTAYAEYGAESYTYSAIDYLLKPFTFDRFSSAVDKVRQSLSAENTTRDSIRWIKDGHKMHRIKLDDVLYIEGLREYISWHTIDCKIVEHNSLKSAIAELASKGFIQVHKSYIINKSNITSYDKSSVNVGQANIPIGRKFKRDFLYDL